MQTAEAWSNNQAKRRPKTTPKDKACTAAATAVQPLQISKVALKVGFLDRSIPFVAYDMVCTPNAVILGNPIIPTDKVSTKVVFTVVTGFNTLSPTVAKLHRPV